MSDPMEAIASGAVLVMHHTFLAVPAGHTSMECEYCGAVYDCSPGGGIFSTRRMLRGPPFCMQTREGIPPVLLLPNWGSETTPPSKFGNSFPPSWSPETD